MGQILSARRDHNHLRVNPDPNLNPHNARTADLKNIYPKGKIFVNVRACLLLEPYSVQVVDAMKPTWLCAVVVVQHHKLGGGVAKRTGWSARLQAK